MGKEIMVRTGEVGKVERKEKNTLVMKGVRDEGRDENLRLNMDTTLTKENIDNGRRKTRKKRKKKQVDGGRSES